MPELEFQSAIVDELSYACGFQNEERVCIFCARYRSYLVVFLMRMGDGTLADKNFIAGIQEIDRKMEACFSP